MYKVPFKCLSQKQRHHKDLINYEKITLKIKTNYNDENNENKIIVMLISRLEL